MLINNLNVAIEIAKVAHEVNRAYCQWLGDYTQEHWDDAEGWQRISATKGVQMHLANPEATPADSHASWMEQKEKEGWTFGPKKDSEKKEHPCFLPYSELPIEQRAKDYLFKAVVNAMRAIYE